MNKPFPMWLMVAILVFPFLSASAEITAEMIAKAENGDADAQFNVGLAYYNQKDYANAVKWYELAAEKDYALAQNNLGVCYDKGTGVKKNPVEAAKWYGKAAEQGMAIAQHNLGYCYYHGLGVEKDYDEAYKWYRKAAEQGNKSAISKLYYWPTSKIEKLRMLANLGHAESQYLLAVSYAKGEGVKQNMEEAAKWYKKAAEQGHTKAKAALGL